MFIKKIFSKKNTAKTPTSGFDTARDILDYLIEKKQKIRLYANSEGFWEVKVGAQSRKKKEEQEEKEEKEDKEE